MRFPTLTVLVVVLFVALTIPAAAQTRSGLMLFGGMALPNGEFGKTEGAEAGFAKMGFFGGAEIMFSLTPGVGIVIDGRYSVNKLNEEEILKTIGGGSNVSTSFGSYTGILPMGGLRLYLPSPVAVFVDAQAGYMFAKTPEISYTYSGTTQKFESQNLKGLAYGASAGIDIGNTFVIGGTYIIAKPKSEVTTGSGATATTVTMEQKMNMIQAWVGIRF